MGELEHVAAAVQFLMRNLVDHPDELNVTVIEGKGDSVLFNVALSPEDVGKVIGQAGRTERAFRIILVSISGKLKCRIGLNVGGEEFELPRTQHSSGTTKEVVEP